MEIASSRLAPSGWVLWMGRTSPFRTGTELPWSSIDPTMQRIPFPCTPGFAGTMACGGGGTRPRIPRSHPWESPSATASCRSETSGLEKWTKSTFRWRTPGPGRRSRSSIAKATTSVAPGTISQRWAGLWSSARRVRGRELFVGSRRKRGRVAFL